MLQPQNILLTTVPPSGDIKLCDFGFARHVYSGEDILDIVGTPDYVGEYSTIYYPLRLQYVILGTKSQNRCDYCMYIGPIRTYVDFAIEIWGFYRRLTDTLRYHHTMCSRASGLQLAAIF